MAAQHRAEALKAITFVKDALADKEPVEGLRRLQLRATLEYAIEEVTEIREVKRERKAQAE